MQEKQLKILYAAGPGDVIGTFFYWEKGEDDPSQVSMTFSGQFYDACSDLNAKGYIISTHAEKKTIKKERFILEHRPIPLSSRSGVLYHLGAAFYALSLVFTAVRFNADIVVATGDVSHLFVLSLLPLWGIKVVPTFHCVLWPKFKTLGKLDGILWRLNGVFLKRYCASILSTSEDINSQIELITNNNSKPIKNFLSTYRRTVFEDVASPDTGKSSFHVLFAGRVEIDKGVLVLLEVAKVLQSEGHLDIVFHVCGTGSALDLLVTKIEEYNIGETFKCHGYCKRPYMKQMFELSHVVIVPTTSDFIEGLNQVVIEGVLSGRPVITSSVCPAISYVREAVVEVPPDNTEAYKDAVLKLHHDASYYLSKLENCKKLQEQFYDMSNSWQESLKSTILRHGLADAKSGESLQTVDG